MVNNFINLNCASNSMVNNFINQSRQFKLIGCTLCAYTFLLVKSYVYIFIFQVCGLEFSTLEPLLASGAGDGLLKIWDLRELRLKGSELKVRESSHQT